jgi:protein-tyrosine-phosphatase
MSTPLTPELLDASVRLLKALDYTGVAMVEFKVDPKTGHWALIEVNGRFWGSLPLALAAGADFPLALFRMLVEGRTDFPKGYRVGVCCRNWESDVEWLSANLRADRTDPTLTTRSLAGVVAEAVKNVTLLRERSDTFAVDDPGPAWHELAELARRKWSGLRGKLERRLMRSGPARRRSEARLRVRLRGARRLLFVCKGNICRSPFAEAVARGCPGSTPEVESAGYLPRPGRPSPEHALDAAAALGIDLSGHRSQVLTDALVDQADVIFVFDYENYRHVVTTCPSARGRVFPLGALCAAGPLFIEDPWGRGPLSFEECYRQIGEALGHMTETFERGGHGTAAHTPGDGAATDAQVAPR